MAGQTRLGPGDHPQPGGGPGRRRAQPAAAEGCGSRASRRHGPDSRRGQGRQVMPLSLEVRAVDGSVTGLGRAWTRPSSGSSPTCPVLHQVVTAQLAAARAGTQSTKTRAEVSGGGRKPFKQKGTGRARQGSERAPAVHRRRGRPRSQAPQLPPADAPQDDPAGPALGPVGPGRRRQGRGRRRLALGGPEHQGGPAAPATPSVSTGKVLVVLARTDEDAYKSFRNLPGVQLILGERAQRLRHPLQRLDRVHPRDAAGRGRTSSGPGSDAAGWAATDAPDRTARGARTATRPARTAASARRCDRAGAAGPDATGGAEDAAGLTPGDAVDAAGAQRDEEAGDE